MLIDVGTAAQQILDSIELDHWEEGNNLQAIETALLNISQQVVIEVCKVQCIGCRTGLATQEDGSHQGEERNYACYSIAVRRCLQLTDADFSLHL